MTGALEIVFWAVAALLVYSYAGYPLLLMALGRVLTPEAVHPRKSGKAPRVSIVVAAYNEEAVIGAKIKGALELDYPPDRLDVWVASDGSTDRTEEIVRAIESESERVHLLAYPRMGKSGVLNKAVEKAGGDIIVFSDANTEFTPGAVARLVERFDDERVGCVSGRLVYRNPGEVTSGRAESLYWRYETALKKMENGLGYVAGANGAIYAIRRELFAPLRPGTINDDFVVSMRIVEKGFRCVYEAAAVAFEDVAPDMESEFRRHVRDGAGHYIAVVHLWRLLNPLLGVRAFIYWSHRVLRWSAPFMMIGLWAANIVLAFAGKPFYAALLAAHTAFYAMALAGLVVSRSGSMPFFLFVPFYFCNMNLALLCGFAKVLAGTQKSTWERTERG